MERRKMQQKRSSRKMRNNRREIRHGNNAGEKQRNGRN